MAIPVEEDQYKGVGGGGYAGQWDYRPGFAIDAFGPQSRDLYNYGPSDPYLDRPPHFVSPEADVYTTETSSREQTPSPAAAQTTSGDETINQQQIAPLDLKKLAIMAALVVGIVWLSK